MAKRSLPYETHRPEEAKYPLKYVVLLAFLAIMAAYVIFLPYLGF